MKRQLYLISFENYNRAALDIVEKETASSKKICYVTLNKTHLHLQEQLSKRKVNVSKFQFIDLITPSLFKIIPKENCTFVEATAELSKLAETIINVVLKNKSDLVIIDSVSSLLISRHDKEIISFLTYISSFLQAKKTSMILFALIEDSKRPAIKQVKMMVDESKYVGMV